MPQICRGQRGDRRLSETRETHVVWLITQRSRVQIPPPLPSLQVRRPLQIMEGAFCVCRVHGIVHTASEEGRRGDWR